MDWINFVKRVAIGKAKGAVLPAGAALITKGSLSTTAKRWIFRTMTPELYRANYTANKALRYLKKLGIGINRSDALKIWKDEMYREKRRQVIQQMTGSVIPTEEMLNKSTVMMPRNYRYVL